MLRSLFIIDFLENLIFDSSNSRAAEHIEQMKQVRKLCSKNCKQPAKTFKEVLGVGREKVQVLAKSNDESLIVGIISEDTAKESANWKLIDDVHAFLASKDLEKIRIETLTQSINRIISKATRSADTTITEINNTIDKVEDKARALNKTALADLDRLNRLQESADQIETKAIVMSEQANDLKTITFWEKHKLNILVYGMATLLVIISILIAFKLIK